MNNINNDAGDLQHFFLDGLPYFIVNSVMIICISTVMLIVNAKLAILVLIPVPFLIIYTKKMFPRLWNMYHKKWVRGSRLKSIVNDTLKGMRVVKAFGKGEEEVARFRSTNNGFLSIETSLGRFSSVMFPLMWFLMTLGSLIVWGVGSWEVQTGKLTFGTLITFTGYIGMLYGPLEFMTRIVDWWSGCMNAAQRIFEIIDAVPDITESPDAVHMPEMKGHLKLEKVTFGYEPNKSVLKDISFEVKAGEMLGIVGHSGAGKSTIANLVNRLYDPVEGAIYIDGVNLRDIALKDLRKQIGMVSQESFIFSGTVTENIAYAKPDASRTEVIRAAKAADAHDFIMKMPDGYDTMLGKGGNDLSGGERQRLSIARAILHNPKILILDEATASMDTMTESRIQQSLEKLVRGRTTISIAHRLSTLRNADRLVVVEGGKLIEYGTHNELIKAKGAYYRMVQKQSEALRLKGVGD